MYRCETFREPWNREDILTTSVENYLNQKNIKRENIVGIETFGENGYIYCMLIWEE